MKISIVPKVFPLSQGLTGMRTRSGTTTKNEKCPVPLEQNADFTSSVIKFNKVPKILHIPVYQFMKQAVKNQAMTSYCRIDSSKDDSKRLVVVRYYLDRPGYDIHNSSARVWKDPPAIATSLDISEFLIKQGIIPETTASNHLLAEAYLDSYGCYMLLEACVDNMIIFDFTEALPQSPGIINIRLTDLSELQTTTSTEQKQTQRCNTSPVGLFAFAMTVGFDAVYILRKLVDGSVEDSYPLTFGPYAFFVSGLLQLLVGLNEISRNNIYGATAFLGFGCFWLANGLKLILLNYFPEEIPDSLLGGGSDKLGNFVREFFIMIFACALFYQSLSMNKLTTFLLGTLITYLLAASLTGWNEIFEWIKMVLGFTLSLLGLFLFMAELSNEVYQRDVFKLYPWKKQSSGEVFGAAGRKNTLQHEAIHLRTAGLSDMLMQKSTFNVRAVRPPTSSLSVN